jgi:CheY-like chemotaxis protein
MISCTAKDGVEGLAMIADQSFDFILCDVQMPQMNGMEFLKAGGISLFQLPSS